MTKRQKDNLITVAIRDHDRGDRLQTVNNQPVDFVEQLVTRLMNENCHLPYEWKLSLALDYRIVSFKSALNVTTNRQSNQPFCLFFCLEAFRSSILPGSYSNSAQLVLYPRPKTVLVGWSCPNIICTVQLPTSNKCGCLPGDISKKFPSCQFSITQSKIDNCACLPRDISR